MDWLLPYFVLIFLLYYSIAALTLISSSYKKPMGLLITASYSYINLKFYYNFAIAIYNLSNDDLLQYSLTASRQLLYTNYHPEIISIIIILKQIDISYFSHYEYDREPIVFLHVLYFVLKYSQFDYFCLYMLIEVLFITMLKKIGYLRYSTSAEAGFYVALLLVLRYCFQSWTFEEILLIAVTYIGMGILFYCANFMFFGSNCVLNLIQLECVKFENLGNADHHSRMLNFIMKSGDNKMFFLCLFSNLLLNFVVFCISECFFYSYWKIFSVFSVLGFSVSLSSLLNWERGNEILIRYSSNGLSIGLTLFGIAYLLDY